VHRRLAVAHQRTGAGQRRSGVRERRRPAPLGPRIGVEPMKLQGQVALVTGASRGIGREIAVVLADEGARVAVNYRARPDAAAEVVEAIEAAGGKAVAVAGDIADPHAAADVVAQTRAELGGLHILVNNAGIARDGLIYDLSADDWLDVMRVNFGGVFN